MQQFKRKGQLYWKSKETKKKKGNSPTKKQKQKRAKILLLPSKKKKKKGQRAASGKQKKKKMKATWKMCTWIFLLIKKNYSHSIFSLFKRENILVVSGRKHLDLTIFFFSLPNQTHSKKVFLIILHAFKLKWKIKIILLFSLFLLLLFYGTHGTFWYYSWVQLIFTFIYSNFSNKFLVSIK